MSRGILLSVLIFAATAVLIVIGTLYPVPAAAYYAGGRSLLRASSTPQDAVDNLVTEIRQHAWQNAYDSLANRAEFTEPEFVQDLTGSDLSLRTFAALDAFDVRPLHQSADAAEMTLKLTWSTIVGPFDTSRDLHLVRNGDRWAVNWPIQKMPHVPPQVIAVNYLRWDVIYRGPGDDWGAQNVEAPHVRIVDMHPLNRAEGMVVMGELLNDDVIPAFVSVRATLLTKSGAVIASEGSFDMISHTLLPKQVTPFLIDFPGVDLSQVGSIRMQPVSVLVSASADPVVEILNQQYSSTPGGLLTGQLSNQSGQTVNIAHVLSTFYDKDGQLVWVAGQYVDRALQPQAPVDFQVPVPIDLAKKVSSERTIVATYRSENSL
ncbi:MAG TPA: hypothetical protein VMD92_13910 [Acidobacteriaceae bacterium]|nr:hypothetical protein [Acidobacteriaceae bacterium]